MPEPMSPDTDTALEHLTRRVTMLADRAGYRLGIRLPPFEVRADLRGLAAGRCVIRRERRVIQVTIRFNLRVREEAWILADALAETAPHEVAHGALGVWSMRSKRRLRPHGPEWLALCQYLGGSGRTTHDLPLKRARRHREFEYELEGGERVWLGPVRHRRLQEGRARYFLQRHAVAPGAHTGRWRYRQ